MLRWFIMFGWRIFLINSDNYLKMNDMMIRKGFLVVLAAAAVLVAGCAKSEKTEENEASRRYLDAWVSVNYPDVKPTDLGIYILDDQPGTGEVYDTKQTFIVASYTIRDLEGNISATTDRKLAQQVGDYTPSYYYGSHVWISGEGNLAVGVEDLLKGMRVGGTRTALIPSWLYTTDRYRSNSDYIKKKNNNGNTSGIYTVTLDGLSDDILKVEIDSMEVYSKRYLGGVDSTSYGFYYKQIKAPEDTNAFPSDTTIYINYTGRLLNRQVFDTTDPDTAKMYNIYSSSKTYEPVGITWGDSYSELKMTSSSSSDSDDSDVITGFARTLWKMRKYGKSVGMFFSPYGYSYSGSGSIIPSYAPLVFEIEVVDNPND